MSISALIETQRAIAAEIEAEQVAHLIADVLDAPNDEAVAATVRAKAAELCKRFPVYGK